MLLENLNADSRLVNCINEKFQTMVLRENFVALGKKITNVFITIVFFFFFATPTACGSFQARDQIRTTAVIQDTEVTILDP